MAVLLTVAMFCLCAVGVLVSQESRARLLEVRKEIKLAQARLHTSSSSGGRRDRSVQEGVPPR